MVDTGTGSHLDDSGQREFRSLLPRLQESLRRRGIHDGFDLGTEWSVWFIDGVWAISNGTEILDGVTSSRSEVIKALYADAVQNLNR